MAARLKDEGKPPALRWPKGVFRKYVDQVTSASERGNDVEAGTCLRKDITKILLCKRNHSSRGVLAPEGKRQ